MYLYDFFSLFLDVELVGPTSYETPCIMDFSRKYAIFPIEVIDMFHQFQICSITVFIDNDIRQLHIATDVASVYVRLWSLSLLVYRIE